MQFVGKSLQGLDVITVEENVRKCLSKTQLKAVRDIVRETGYTYSEVNNAINVLTHKIPIYEDRVNDMTVYGILDK